MPLVRCFSRLPFLRVIWVFGFAATTPPGNYSVARIATGLPAIASPMNSTGQVVGSGGDSSFLWIPLAPNANAGSLVTPVGDSGMFAESINNLGQVAGYYCSASQVLQLVLLDTGQPELNYRQPRRDCV